MLDRDELTRRYQVTPEPFWQIVRSAGGGGYDAMEAAAAHGWTAIPSWAGDGWDLGTWPYVVIFTRTTRSDRWEMAQYVEGDVAAYAFPDQATRDTVLDWVAFWYWQNAEASWVTGYQRVDQLPPRLRGPFGVERAGAARLVRALWIPVEGPAEVWYVRTDAAVLSAIIGGPLQVVHLSADAHAYCDEEGKMLRRLVNEKATALWYRVVAEAAGADVLVGDVIVLGSTGLEADPEGDCPQWPIEFVLGAPAAD